MTADTDDQRVKLRRDEVTRLASMLGLLAPELVTKHPPNMLRRMALESLMHVEPQLGKRLVSDEGAGR